MGTLWRYQRDGVECGPVSADDLRMLADSLRLRPTDLVCKNGTNHWFPASGIRGLFPTPAPPAPRWGPTILVCCVLAVLVLGGGLAGLLYALHVFGGAPTASPPPPGGVPPVPGTTSPTPTPTPSYTHLRKALPKMRDALGELQHGGREKIGGRKEEVTKALDKAVSQTEKALLAVGVDVTAKDDSDDSDKYPDHAHLRDALAEIIAAEAEIKDSSADLGGEKDQTLFALDVAIDQLQKALNVVK